MTTSTDNDADAGASAHSLPNITSDEVAEKYADKMKEIALRERERLTEEQAAKLGLGYINLRGFPIGPDTLTLIPREEAQKLQSVAFFSQKDEIRIGSVRPDIPGVAELIARVAKDEGANVQQYLISPNSLAWAMKLYDNVSVPRAIVEGVSIKPEDLIKFQKEMSSLADLHKRIKKVPITDVITIILAGAIQVRASDIHLEAEERDVKIRYRIDGALQTVSVIAKDSWRKIVNRIKLLAGLKINIDNVPQDGRVTIHMPEDTIDVRVSTLPSAYGESVVMRLLMSATAGLQFDQLGLRGRAYTVLEREIAKPNGMVITTGPTSSGKTTTLYAALTKLNTPERKIITLEDPIEYHLAGINQSQIDHSKNYTFAKGLRAILRQNPDIVMVGEIRDEETADIAIHAALTGHLVLSTLHTNNAAGAVPRFLAMGIKPFLVAPALNAVIAQRLVRRVCESCITEETLPPEKLERVRGILGAISPASGEKVDMNNLHFFHGTGCDQCHGIGLKGRIGVYEIFTMNDEIEQIILSGKVSEHMMQEIAVKNGMVLMVQDGLLKALDGLTTVDEVFRVARGDVGEKPVENNPVEPSMAPVGKG